jgi:hypothetical protein
MRVPPEEESRVLLRQGDRCVPVPAFTGDRTVEAFYDYRIPERFASETNGGSDPGSGPYYASFGTETLQQDGTSLLFLYDGPEGLSLVVVHDSIDGGPSDGGAATFEIDGLPDDGTWAVRDDYYLDPDSGEIATTNYDNWQVDGSTHVIDWTWGDSGTDGGAFRGLDGAFPVTIDPAFDEAAALYGEHYDGTVDSWQLLVPDGAGLQRMELDTSSPVTFETGACSEVSAEPTVAPEVTGVEFKGCGQAWIVFEEPFEGSSEAAVETTAGWERVEISGDDLRRVPGQFGDRPLYKWRARGPEKILAARTPGGRVENDNACAGAGRNGGESAGESPDGEADGRGPGNGNAHGHGNGRGNGDGERGPPDHAGPPEDRGD